MKFLSIYKSAEKGVPPSQEEMSRMGQLIEKGMKDGTLLATEGCLPSALGARVRFSGGKLTVTDGPFTEAKEVIWRLRYPPGKLEGRGHRNGQEFPPGSR
jgi:hypothetical protein